nr:elongator complex protein 1 [Cryptococcus depauperatus CBS 7855]
MRSLSPLALTIQNLPPGQKPSNLVVDPETDSLYVAVETAHQDLQVEILKVQRDSLEPVASFTSPVISPFPKPTYLGETLSLHYLADDRVLVALLAGGDIVTVTLEGPDGSVGTVEVVGSVESGIKAAAWSPDDEQIILVTGEDNIVCMTRNFDVIHEEPLRSEDFGEDKFINVGWGSKSTQFHGSIGKSAARQSTNVASSFSHPTDHGLPTISFRGDASFFAISSLDSYSNDEQRSRRQIRIYSRDASAGLKPKLSATSESLPGLEPALAWRPSGNLISTMIRYGYEGGGEGREGRWDVGMIERNGLRHGGFELREHKDSWKEGRIRGLGWNSDSEVLAVWVERKDRDVLQLWSMKNYHYYLKQELFSSEFGDTRFRGFKWHPEEPLSLFIIQDNSIQHRTFTWDTYASRLSMPRDTASVAVVDGTSLLVTPFRTQNTPPPMSSYQLTLPSTPVHACLSDWEDKAAAVFSDGEIIVWKLNTRLPGPKGSRLRGGGRVAEPEVVLRTKIGGSRVMRNIALGPNGKVAVLSLTTGCEQSGCVNVFREKGEEEFKVQGNVERILWTQEEDGEVLVMNGEGNLYMANPTPIEISFPSSPTSLLLSNKLLFALSPNSKLYMTPLAPHAHPILISQQPVTSFSTTSSFLVFTTSSHFAHFAPFTILKRLAEGEDLVGHEMKWEERRIERGVRIVVAAESEMSLVLQAMRGNLETIYPRPMVLQVVKRDVLAGAYRRAFLTCRKHRLDLNILYDLDPSNFMDNLDKFVEQVPEVDYLNLFNSREGNTPFPVNKVNTICDSLRRLIVARGVDKYIETILTTHVCKVPADYEAGLEVLLQLQTDYPEIVENAIKYIIFLSDVNKLYDVALGMYNFQLVLMVAQYSQKDPKEYLPFLRELRALDKWDQRFRIDDHLERRERALANLKQAGDERFDEAVQYLAKYELYDTAFKLYADENHHLAANYLYDRREFTDAALPYLLANKPRKALKAYERAHAWRELFTLAKQEDVADLSEFIERVTDYLGSRGRHLEAAQVFIEYAKDIDSAVDTCCQGTEFSEAYRLVSVHDRKDLIEAMIHPGLEEAQEALVEIFEEMEEQLDKETKRLCELKDIRERDYDAFYIVERELDLEGVDVATNATTVASQFTRYTVAPSTMTATTRMTGQTNRTKRGKKRATGRRGTVDEWEYLVMSIGRLLARVDEKSSEAITLLRHLLLASPDHTALAKSLQSTIISFRTKLSKSLDIAWQDREVVLKEVTESGGSGLEGGLEKSLGEVKPIVGEWKGLGFLLRD